MTRAVIFDIDGTLADTRHRQHYMLTKHKNWPAFYAAMSDDPPRSDVVELLRALAASYRIVLCSGRPANYRDATVTWLKDHRIPFWDLHMRAEGDFRDDTVVKREMLSLIRVVHGDPFLVVDDRDKVVAMWRAEGLTCLQCAPGDF